MQKILISLFFISISFSSFSMKYTGEVLHDVLEEFDKKCEELGREIKKSKLDGLARLKLQMEEFNLLSIESFQKLAKLCKDPLYEIKNPKIIAKLEELGLITQDGKPVKYVKNYFIKNSDSTL